MLNEREQAIKNTLLDHLGGPPSFVGPNKTLGYLDPEYVRISLRRMAVNKRRMVIFTVLYTLVVMTAVAATTAMTQDYNAVLWVVVATFNAVNAAIHYAEYQKKKMAFAVFEFLRDEE